MLKALAKALAANGVDLGALGSARRRGEVPTAAKFVAVLAKDLAANKGSRVMFVGERQPAAVHALAFAINVALGGGMQRHVRARPSRSRVSSSTSSRR